MTIFGAGRMGMFRESTAAPPATATPVSLGTPTVHVNSTNPHTTDTATHTVDAGTEVLLLIVFYGPDTATEGGELEDTPTSDVDGAFDLLFAAPFGGGAGSGSNPFFGIWAIESPTAGAHDITYGGTNEEDLAWSGFVAINLDDVDTADPFGDITNLAFSGTAVADSNTFADSLTTEKSNSLVIAWGAWQGADALPITPDLGLLPSFGSAFSTDGGATTDGSICIAAKVGPASPGSVAFGMTASVSDDYAYGAIEIRGAGP